MKHMYRNDKNFILAEPCDSGFIALMAAIMIGAILLVVTSSLAQSGWNVRFQILDLEYKSLGISLADSCASEALLLKLQNPAYSGNASSTVSGGICYVAPFEYSAKNNHVIIRVTTIVSRSYTTMVYEYDVQNIHTSEIPLRPLSVSNQYADAPILMSRQEVFVTP